MIDFLNCGITPLTFDGQSDSAATLSIPEAWVRASILVRVNSLARGHSGVRSAVLEGLISLLNHNIIPVVPLRGSISASGDLIPLSYIAGALQGKRGINVFTSMRPSLSIDVQHNAKWSKGLLTPPSPTSPYDANIPIYSDTSSQSSMATTKTAHGISSNLNKVSPYKQPIRHIVPSHDALADLGLSPLKFEPKEGLSLVNGTAVSAATGALAMHDAQGMAVLAQILTAMSVEALNGTIESFDPFFGNVRPHPGQIEAAANIRCFLKGSKLVRTGDADSAGDPHGLRQDRYSLRTTPQWIGPQLEKLMLAQRQVEIECNSTTDNPLLDVENGKVLHGGNFQALAITSAMETVRQSLQQFGRMLFVQCSELVNPAMNNGLPPNLEAGEPSEGFLMKGVDISTAALCSELGYLANPMTPHVQTAEMGNQSLNSMAFVSARYTHTALDVISQLAASHLFALCQALDLRCIQSIFFGLVEVKIMTKSLALHSRKIDKPGPSKLHQELWSKFQTEFTRTATQDSGERFHNIFKSCFHIITSATDLDNDGLSFSDLNKWAQTLGDEAAGLYKGLLDDYKYQPSAFSYLGSAAYRMYTFVRHELGVPFHGGKGGFSTVDVDYSDVTVGEMISKICAAIKDGRVIGVAMDTVRETCGSDL